MLHPLPRRRLGAWVLGAALAAAITVPALAQDFPARPVQLLVGFAPGGGSDIIARLVAPALSEALGQAVVVENRAGASGTIAAGSVARAKPDGHTLLMGHVSSNAMVPPLMPGLPYDPVKDFRPVGIVGTVPQVLVVPASSPARDLAGFIALLKAQPGKVNYASSGIGTQQHMAAELFRLATGTSMVHVPYRGSGQAVNDLVAGGVDANFDTLPTVMPFIQSGALRPLAVTVREPLASLPGVPTVAAAAAVPDFDVSTWYMLMTPAGTPDAVVARLSRALEAALARPEVRQRFAGIGTTVGGGGPEVAQTLLVSEVERWARVVKEGNIRAE